MKKKLKSTPGYIEGVRQGLDIIKFIDHTIYESVSHAVIKKTELLKDLEIELGWDDTKEEVQKVKGIIDTLEKALPDVENSLCLDDIDKVAKSINKQITQEEALEILNLYSEAQKNDPNATWELVVENLIHQS